MVFSSNLQRANGVSFQNIFDLCFFNNERKVGTERCDGMEKLRKELIGGGVSQFSFLEKEYEQNLPSQGIIISDEESHFYDLVPIKTLVWKVTETGQRNMNDGQDTTQSDTYLVTAVRSQDRVDHSLFLKNIETEAFFTANNLSSETVDICLAETEIAEQLTGYISGCIPPIAHTENMTLFIDDRILHGDAPKNRNKKNIQYVSIGAGSLEHSLIMKLDDMINFAKSVGTVRICPLSQTKKKKIQKSSEKVGSAGSNNKDIRKPISKRLRDAAGKLGRSDEVRELIEECGENFPSLMAVGKDGNFTKNALHLAAWKGDLKSIEYLVEAGNKFGLDLVNRVSIGEGNYGKSAIFYAITQDRDDAVKLLISFGANLLIVNNKGQTPSSMSPSHLKNDTRQLIHDKEAEQLSSGMKFINYRDTNSDGKQYGDLDPRFDIDDINMGEDIVEEIELVRRSLESLDNLPNVPIPVGIPRSLRQTTAEIRKKKAEINRRKSTKHSSVNKQALLSDKEVEQNTEFNSILKKLKPRQKRTKQEKAIVDVVEIEQLNEGLNNLDLLKMCDLIQDSDVGSSVILVNDENSLLQLAQATDESLRRKHEIINNLKDGPREHLLSSAWGLDCEWKPSREKGHDNPIATLQLSTSNQSFVIDVFTLCQTGVVDPLTEMNRYEEQLSQILRRIFVDDDIAILGFGIGQDLGKLVASFPHMPCFSTFACVIDIQMVAKKIFPREVSRNSLSSLQKSVAFIMRKRMNKEEQCSNWECRPLTLRQIIYASLDAVVLPFLIEKMLNYCDTKTSLESLIAAYPELSTSIRFTYLDQSIGRLAFPHNAYQVQQGRSKQFLKIWYARQIWRRDERTPLLPTKTSASRKIKKVEDRSAPMKKKVNKSQSKKKGDAVFLKEVVVDFQSLPSAGEVMDFTKDSCISGILGEEFYMSLPDSAYLAYNRRAGVLQLSNAWFLFANFGGSKSYIKYRNEFRCEGRQLTFSIKPKNNEDSSLLYFFTANKDSLSNVSNGFSKKEKKVFLFIRPSLKSKFMFCGECSCAEKQVEGYLVNLVLTLENYDELISKKIEEGSSYMEMVHDHQKKENNDEQSECIF